MPTDLRFKQSKSGLGFYTTLYECLLTVHACLLCARHFKFLLILDTSLFTQFKANAVSTSA